MKVIVPENRMVGLIDKFLLSLRPQVFNLEKFEMKFKENLFAYKFSDPNENKTYFWFNLSDPFDDYPSEVFPVLQVDHELYEDIVRLFGSYNAYYIIDWFEKTYGYRAETVVI